MTQPSPSDRLAAVFSTAVNSGGVAQRAKVDPRQAANALKARPVEAGAYLRLCIVLNYDPSPDLKKPEDWTGCGDYGAFDFGRLALALRIKRGLLSHSERWAGAKIGISGSTVSRLENAHQLSIGVVLKACGYIEVHPFSFLTIAAKTGTYKIVSRETFVPLA